MLNLHGSSDVADEVHRIAEVLPPGYLRGFRARHWLVMIIVIDRASISAVETKPFDIQGRAEKEERVGSWKV